MQRKYDHSGSDDADDGTGYAVEPDSKANLGLRCAEAVWKGNLNPATSVDLLWEFDDPDQSLDKQI